MKKTYLVLLIVLFTACSVNTAAPDAAQNQQEQISLPSTNTPLVQTSTLIPTATATLAATIPNNVPVLTNDEPDLIATSLNFQIDEYELTMTAAANQIASLQAQKATLIPAATSAAGSSGGTTSSSGYIIPANVYTVTVIHDAFLEITKRNNNKGVPIMEQVQPQIKLDPGFLTWVYKDYLVADGGAKYYKVFDPDGESAEDYYLRYLDIQIKMPNGSPPPATYPGDVVKVKTISNAAANYIVDYDSKGKPIMATYDPIIRYETGDRVLVHGRRVFATGNKLFVAIYDPDGKSSLYLVVAKIEFLLVWD